MNINSATRLLVVLVAIVILIMAMSGCAHRGYQFESPVLSVPVLNWTTHSYTMTVMISNLVGLNVHGEIVVHGDGPNLFTLYGDIPPGETVAVSIPISMWRDAEDVILFKGFVWEGHRKRYIGDAVYPMRLLGYDRLSRNPYRAIPKGAYWSITRLQRGGLR